MKSNPKVFGSICHKHPHLNGLRAGVYRNHRYTPGVCVTCHVEDAAIWRKNNKERHAEILKKSKLKNRAKAYITAKKWKSNNPEKVAEYNRKGTKRYYEKNKEKRKAYHRELYWSDIENSRLKQRVKERKHRPQGLARTRFRQAMKLRATPKWANKFIMEEAYDLASRRSKINCGGVKKWHVDHIVPLRSKIVCGLHVHNNLQVIPSAENMSKGNRHWPDMPSRNEI